MNQKTYVFEGVVVAEQPLATCSKDLLDREGRKNAPTPIPTTQTPKGLRLMFPASGLRGGIRRACRDVVRNAVIEKTGNEKPFSLETHFMLTLGGIKGSGEEDKASIKRIAELREKNPLINLFGAGDAGTAGFVAGRVGMGNAICTDDMEPVIFSGSRSDDIYRDPDQATYLTDVDLTMLTELSAGNRELSRMKADATKLKRTYAEAKNNGDKEATAQASASLKELDEKMASVRKESGSKSSVGMPLAGWKAIPQGAEMDHKMILRRANGVDLGLFLASLNAFSTEPLVGAHYANGNGLISAHWDVYEVTLTGKRSVGRVRLRPFDTAEVSGEVLADAQQAFMDFIDAELWDFTMPEKV